MNYDYASAMAAHLGAIQGELNSAVTLARSKADPQDLPTIQKSIGMLMAKLDTELLWPIYRKFPDLNTLGSEIPE